MIQLYKASNTEFTSNGDFILDPVITKAELSVELNGTWELTLTAVIEDSGYFSRLTVLSNRTFSQHFSLMNSCTESVRLNLTIRPYLLRAIRYF